MASMAMTVSPCPPRESLKRNRHHASPIDAAYPVLNDDSTRLLKRRCFQTDIANEENIPIYTQRQFEYLEQAKQAEMNHIRTECEQILLRKEREMHEMRLEFDQLREICLSQAKEIEKIQGENKILRRAVTIQNQQKEEVTQENNVLKQLAHQAAEHIKRLEQTNYALCVHLQTSTGSASSSNQFSSDVY